MVGWALARDNLRLGWAVVADSVNPIDVTRTEWRNVAAEAGRPGIEVEVVCSDPVEHRQRIDTRTADISGLRLPTWHDVLDRENHPWDRDRIVIDTAGTPPQECVDELLSRVRPALSQAGCESEP